MDRRTAASYPSISNSTHARTHARVCARTTPTLRERPREHKRLRARERADKHHPACTTLAPPSSRLTFHARSPHSASVGPRKQARSIHQETYRDHRWPWCWPSSNGTSAAAAATRAAAEKDEKPHRAAAREKTRASDKRTTALSTLSLCSAVAALVALAPSAPRTCCCPRYPWYVYLGACLLPPLPARHSPLVALVSTVSLAPRLRESRCRSVGLCRTLAGIADSSSSFSIIIGRVGRVRSNQEQHVQFHAS